MMMIYTHITCVGIRMISKIERSNTVLANVLLLDVNRIAKTSNDTKLSLAQISVEFVFDDNNQWIVRFQ